MRSFLLKIALLGIVFSFCTKVRAESMLEIHHIGSGDGDATLIIAIDKVGINVFTQEPLWDTCVVLIDGQRSNGGKEVWRYLSDTISTRFPNRLRIDFIVLTHPHVDHYQGLTGVLTSAGKDGWSIGAVIDGQNADYSNYLPIPDHDCYDDLDYSQPSGSTFTKYNTALTKMGLTPTIDIVPGVDLFSGLGFLKLSMICVVANGRTLGNDGFYNFLPSQKSGGTITYKPKSPNDLSIGFLIVFEGFHYMTLGDLGGKTGGSYVDGETPVTEYLMNSFDSDRYHMCGLKVSHHGSAESTSEWFANKNWPTLAIIEAALRSYGKSKNALPTEETVTTLNNIDNVELLYTFVPFYPDDIESYWTKGNLNLWNDVIVKIQSPPGTGDNISMTVIQAQKSKKFPCIYNGVRTIKTVTCNKGHNW